MSDVTPKRPSAKTRTKVTLSKVFTKKNDNVITEVKVQCGNESIKPSQFLDEKVASKYMCALCKGVPSKPRQLDLCRQIYCRKCLESEATTYCAIEETLGEKCCRNLDRTETSFAYPMRFWVNTKKNSNNCWFIHFPTNHGKRGHIRKRTSPVWWL